MHTMQEARPLSQTLALYPRLSMRLSAVSRCRYNRPARGPCGLCVGPLRGFVVSVRACVRVVLVAGDGARVCVACVWLCVCVCVVCPCYTCIFILKCTGQMQMHTLVVETLASLALGRP